MAGLVLDRPGNDGSWDKAAPRRGKTAVPMPAPEPNNPNDPIHLLCAADARYGAYAGIMLASVLRANPGERFDIHLLSDRMRRRDLRKIASLTARAGSHCTVYDVAPRLA